MTGRAGGAPAAPRGGEWERAGLSVPPHRHRRPWLTSLVLVWADVTARSHLGDVVTPLTGFSGRACPVAAAVSLQPFTCLICSEIKCSEYGDAPRVLLLGQECLSSLFPPVLSRGDTVRFAPQEAPVQQAPEDVSASAQSPENSKLQTKSLKEKDELEEEELQSQHQ